MAAPATLDRSLYLTTGCNTANGFPFSALGAPPSPALSATPPPTPAEGPVLELDVPPELRVNGYGWEWPEGQPLGLLPVDQPGVEGLLKSKVAPGGGGGSDGDGDGDGGSSGSGGGGDGGGGDCGSGGSGGDGGGA